MGLGADHPAPAHRDAVAEHPRGTGDLLDHHLDHLVHARSVECLALLDQDQELLEHGARLLHRLLGAFQRDLVPARDKTHLREVGLHLSEMSVALPEQVQHQVVARDA